MAKIFFFSSVRLRNVVKMFESAKSPKQEEPQIAQKAPKNCLNFFVQKGPVVWAKVPQI